MMFLNILLTIGCIFIGISASDNFQCRKVDFNKLNSLSVFEQCSTVSEFTIKSYEDNPFVPLYYDDAVNFLSNAREGWSCFSSVEQFTLEADTEFSIAIFLQSLVFDDMSHVEIEVIDLDDGDSVFPVISAEASLYSEWTSYTFRFRRNIANAKISIRAYLTVSANLAIQYINILHPSVDESLCELADETTTEEITTVADVNTCKACTCSCTCN